jgi:hypothetical protein
VSPAVQQLLETLERAARALESGDAVDAGEGLGALGALEAGAGAAVLSAEQLQLATSLQQRCEAAALRLQESLVQALRASGQAHRASAMYGR